MFTYDYAGRLASSTYPSVFSGTISDAYGPDGLLTKRTWPTNSETGTLTYDGAKRPTQVTYGALEQPDRGLRSGRQRRERGPLADRGDGDDRGCRRTHPVARLRQAQPGRERERPDRGIEFAYHDLDSNRKAVTALGVATTLAYDRTDELVQQTIGGVNKAFAYDAYGNLTTSATSGSTQTTNAYDLGDRLLSITPASGTAVTSFAFDALGRFKSRTLTGSVTETYSYLGQARPPGRSPGRRPRRVPSTPPGAGQPRTWWYGRLPRVRPPWRCRRGRDGRPDRIRCRDPVRPVRPDRRHVHQDRRRRDRPGLEVPGPA